MKKQIFTIITLLVFSTTIFGQFKLDATGANDMRLRTNNTDRVNILTNGNVGIGITTPATKLHISGAENNGTTGTLKITTGTTEMLFDGNEIDGASDGQLFLNNNSTGNLHFANGGGNVAIGTTTPTTKLEVNGDLCLKIKLTQPTVNTTYIPYNRDGKSVVTIDPNSSGTVSTIYGFDNPGVFGTILYVINGYNSTLILKHNHDVNGDFSNSIQTNTLSDITINGRGGALLVYDAGGWRLISYAQ